CPPVGARGLARRAPDPPAPQPGPTARAAGPGRAPGGVPPCGTMTADIVVTAGRHPMSEIVVVAAARTPQGRLQGALASFSGPQLGSAAIVGALERGGVDPAVVDAVIVGQVLPAGSGQNPARQAALGAGIGWATPAHSVNKVCLSGLTAVIDAARMITSGDAEVVVAGGMESMSQAPHLLMGSRAGWKYGAVEALDHM